MLSLHCVLKSGRGFTFFIIGMVYPRGNAPRISYVISTGVHNLFVNVPVLRGKNRARFLWLLETRLNGVLNHINLNLLFPLLLVLSCQISAENRHFGE
ncbi:hypothetical protein TW80_02480 [Loktanella sp. S4079]|nr:hypothetical protein TW80_02480 [Loktanella sp. S4079]